MGIDFFCDRRRISSSVIARRFNKPITKIWQMRASSPMLIVGQNIINTLNYSCSTDIEFLADVDDTYYEHVFLFSTKKDIKDK